MRAKIGTRVCLNNSKGIFIFFSAQMNFELRTWFGKPGFIKYLLRRECWDNSKFLPIFI